jgi:hypothetical protein
LCEGSERFFVAELMRPKNTSDRRAGFPHGAQSSIIYIMDKFKNPNIESGNSHLENKEKSKEENDMEDFNFLTEEELSRLDETELFDYYRKAEKKIELDEIENNKKMNEIGNQELLKKQEELKEESLDNLYKPNPDEPYWNK